LFVVRVGMDVEQPRAYLTRTITNLSLNKLKSAAVRRETYVGPWLPEPLVTADDETGHEVEQTEAVSLAMLVVLETLSPLERAGSRLAEDRSRLGLSVLRCGARDRS